MEPGSATHTNEILPADVVPVHYDISIATDFETLTFNGEQKVTLNVQSKTKTIVLNALGLKITSASVGSQQSESIEISEEAETAKIQFASEVGTPGEQITLQLSFTGDLDPNMRGFYKSKREVDGKTNWIAVTQFEPVDARRAFPCWDEPSLKATFAMSLTAPSDMVCLSNMPAKNETDLGNGRKRVDFDTSPKMSTYLVAYCVGNFECVEGQLKSGSKVRVWAVPGKKDQCEYALENGIKILHYYEDYFGIPYPLPKTDMIALPDFQMGAMENWGLITYRETALLCNPATASVAGKSRVVYVIAHELAHQWFGNLVTMAWWKELWLNEGFASFIGSQATAHFYPEWRYWDQFVVSYINSGLKADSSRTSHPIEVEIKTARSVQEIFDVISYQKGASVIKMISDFLGEKVFQKGLQTYLSEHAYGNTVTKDLWDHLSRASGKDVTAAMDNWVKEMGYPVVLVEETGTAGQFKISQRRFLGYGNPTAEEDRVTWNINLAVITESQREIQYVAITQKEQVVTLPAAANEWVKLNAGQSGFYRVQYSSALSQKLTAALSTLSSIDRLGLVNDVFSLAFAGIAPLSQALHLASQYTDETDPGVWGILIDNLSLVYRLFESSQPQLDKLMLKLFSKIGQSLGWSAKDGEDELWKATRPRVLDVLGEHGDPSIIEEAKKRMAEYEKDASSLSLEVASLVFKYWLRASGAEEGKRMIAIYEGLSAAASTSPEWNIKTLACIGYGADLDHSLTYILENDACRAQDFMYPLNCICSTAKGRARAWEFITTNWDRVSTKVSASLLGHVISIITSFSTAERLKEVEEFFSTRANKELERTVKNRLEVIKTNINTVDTQKEKVISYLSENFS